MRAWGSGKLTGKFDCKSDCEIYCEWILAHKWTKMFYAAGSRRSQFLRGRASARSSPLSSIANSSGRITRQLSSVAAGQRKRPFSNRFAHTHSPLPSHTRTFKRVRSRLENRNRCPLSGSCTETIAHQAVESVESLAHVHALDGDVDLRRRTQAEHQALSATRIRRASAASENPHPLAIRRPLPSISTNPVSGSAGASNFTRTNCCGALDRPVSPDVTSQRAQLDSGLLRRTPAATIRLPGTAGQPA